MAWKINQFPNIKAEENRYELFMMVEKVKFGNVASRQLRRNHLSQDFSSVFAFTFLALRWKPIKNSNKNFFQPEQFLPRTEFDSFQLEIFKSFPFVYSKNLLVQLLYVRIFHFFHVKLRISTEIETMPMETTGNYV